MKKNPKKLEILKRGVPLDETAEEQTDSATPKVKSGVRAGMRSVRGVGCGGPNECLA